MTTCPHGFASPTSCINCMDEGPLPPKPRPVPVAYFPARYPGYCPSCGEEIEAGEPITSMTDGSYRHAACAGRPYQYRRT